MNESEKALSEFVIAGGDSAKLLEFLKEALHQMAFFVEPPVAIPGIFLVGLRRDAIRSTGCFNKASDVLRTVGFVTQHHASFQGHITQGSDCLLGIMQVAGGEMHMDGVAQRIYHRVDFRGLTATTNPDLLVDFAVYSPFFAPALC